MENVISVIVPVYNVEAYLPQCLDSILTQDYEKLEVILIDDGSQDHSGAICDAYAARDSRVQVIHQPNAGAAAAKNAGLRVATGEYLSFVDSDDYLEPGAYRYLWELLQEAGVDAVQCAFRDVYRGRQEDRILHPGRQRLDHKAYLLRFPKDWSCPLLWNKLYRRRLFDGVFFEEGHKIDDEYFTYQGFLEPSTVLLDDRVIYNYRRRASSVMGSPAAAEQRILDSLDAIEKRRQRVSARWPELRRAFDENLVDALWYLSERPGNTERTISILKSGLRTYLTTWGNAMVPRYLWGLLARMYLTPTGKLVARCQEKQAAAVCDDYFA